MPYIKSIIAPIFIFWCTNIFACQAQVSTTEESYKRASKVFLGYLQSAEIADTNNTDAELTLIFEVEYGFKGSLDKLETVYTGIGGGDCGLGAPFGKRMLLYVDDNGRADSTNSHYFLKRLVHHDRDEFSEKFDYAGQEKEIYEQLQFFKTSNK